MPRGDDESGIYLPPGEYPKAPRHQPSAENELRLSGPPWRERISKRLRGIPPRTAAAFVATAILGGIIGWLLHPDAKASAGQTKAEERAKTAEAALAKAKQELASAGSAAAAPAAGSGSGGAPDEGQLGKLAAAVGSEGEVTTSGGEIRLQLVDKILFAPGEAVLTSRGKTVLARVGKALNDISDKQIWVQGHTDDEPIVVPKPPAKKPVKGAKGKTAKTAKGAKKPAPAPPPPAPPRFASNWELSAARALTVVHYLQDKVKVDPSRLAAVAFGQYRPASKTRSKNRRIEIVLYPRHSVAPKD